ncbi:caldesmon-like [Camellia sinensis]|uniref:caldesmon-like n=1 Tax=Camellia sinensis TaxID=4442 RepID=UPI001036C99D|nr:caldesmon-like [Camellia sinensis]
MAQEEVVNVRVDPLGDDDGEELAVQYRTEARMVGAGVVEPPKGGDLGRAELEARRKAQEIKDRAILAKAAKFTEAQRDRPRQPIARERIRPRPRPLGEKDLSSFEPRPPPVDPVKEKARKVVEALKKKKKKRSAPEEAADASGAKRAKVAPTEVDVPVAKDTPEVVEIIPTVEVVEIAPSVQVEAGSTEAVPSGMEQVQKRPDPQEGGVRLATAIYHARAVAGRLEGEEDPARAGADRLVKIVEEMALRAISGYNEADLLRGLCSAQMEVTTLAGALLRKAGAAKLKAEEARVQLAKLRKDSADWKTAYADLPAVKLELEDTRRKVVSLEFQLAGEQKKLEESERACAVAVERHEEAMTSNEELVRKKDEADSRIGDLLKELGEERARAEEEKGRLLRAWEMEKAKAVAELESLKKGVEEERATAAAERGALQRELGEERAKAASEKAAYPDLCVAAVEQYKGSSEFQMVVDAAVARSLAGQELGGWAHQGRLLEVGQRQR